MTFRVTATDGAARAGVLETPHGEVPTPAFMPVGTKASVKTLHPDEVRALGASILLGNTYHLHFRPGDEVIAELGSLPAFMGWDRPILPTRAASRSSRSSIRSSESTTTAFHARSTTARRRGSRPSRSHASRRISAPTSPCAWTSARRPASSATSSRRRCGPRDRLGRRQRAAPRPPGQLLFGITQGASDPDLRRRSIEEITALDFDGHALGALGRRAAATDARRHRLGCAAPQKASRATSWASGTGRNPRGDRARIDMFDCVLPTRTARTGSALTWEGRLNLRNARFARDPEPLDGGPVLRAPVSRGRTSGTWSTRRGCSASAC